MTISYKEELSSSNTRFEARSEFGVTTSMLHVKSEISIVRTVLLVLLFVVLVLSFASPAGAKQSDSIGQSPASENLVQVLTIKIGGFYDPQNEALIKNTLKRAQENGFSLYVIQLDSIGIAGGNINKTVKLLEEAELVTAVWVGPTSAKFSKEMKPIIESVDVVGAASKELANKSGTDIVAPSLREFYSKMDGIEVERINYVIDTGCSKEDIEQKIKNCENVKLEQDANFALTIAPLFEKLSPIENLGHSLIKPSFAVGLLVLGLCLLVFEFYAASVGVSAIAGTLAGLGGIYGLGYLPTNWIAVGVLVLGVGALVIDIQAGGVGLYSFLGTGFIFFGALFATERSGAFGVSILGATIVTVMALLFAVGAIPSLIRTRFGTPTIGREDFIGEVGVASGDIDPEGTVQLRGGLWKARTNHATPIKDGQECKIIKIEGIILEVEPLVGAAKDYREKRSKQ